MSKWNAPILAAGVVMLLAAVPAPAMQSAPATTAATDRALNVDTYHAAVLQASGHPNELARWHGMWTYDNGHVDEARRYFERAAFYGDKLSQHFLTLIYWNGDGVERDPVMAYIWADLAAERGNDELLLRMRERIWTELSPQEQQRAVALGQDYYARYGDAVAIKRGNTEMRRFMRTQTGSRVGLLTSKLDISMGKPDLWAGGGRSNFGPVGAMGTDFYADSRTRPDAYWKSEDTDLRALLKRIGQGQVNIGEVRKVGADAKPADGER